MDEVDEPDEAARWKTVGQQLGDARRALRLSKRAAAAKAGFSEAQWRVLEAGERTVARGFVVPVSPRDETLYRAATAVGLAPAPLFRLVGREFSDNGHAVPASERTTDERLNDLEERLTTVERAVDRMLAATDGD